MAWRNSLGILGLSGGALLLGALAACSSPAPESAKGVSSKVTERAFDRNAVLDDKSMRDPEAMTSADVQKFLDKTPWGTKSALATYTEGGKTAAEIMTAAAKTHGINPLEMLVRVQMEQGLISKTTASATTVGIAFGCGCPHSAVCSDKYRGFANQADCAAGTLRRSMDRAVTSAGTVSGWARSKTKSTEDGIAIIPKNAVTAALYTYTPWVGEAGGGKQGVGGVSLHAQVWDRFAESVSYGAWAVQGEANAEDADAGEDAGPTADPAPPVDEADAGAAPGEGEEPAPEPEPGNGDAGTNADAAPQTDTPGADPAETESGSKGAPEDGSEDDAILKEGSTPPSSNAPPPKAKTKTPTKPEELPEATEEELAAKAKAGAGCSAGGREAAGSAWLVGLALVLVASRRRSMT